MIGSKTLQRKVARSMVTQLDRVNNADPHLRRRLNELEEVVDVLRRQLREARAEADNLRMDLDAVRRRVRVPREVRVNVITAAEAAIRSGRSVSTVNRHLNGISKKPIFFGYQTPTGRWMVYADANGLPINERPDEVIR